MLNIPPTHPSKPFTKNSRAQFADLMQFIPRDHFKNPSLIFHQLDSYSDFELDSIYVDMVQLKKELFHENAELKRTYLATAGARGCGKTILLENLLDGRENGRRIYIDPDHILLRMELTYETDLRLGLKTTRKAREYWQEASSFISDLFLAIALNDGYAIAHGTSMTSCNTFEILEKIDSVYHYEIQLLHLTCAEPVQAASLLIRKKRDQVYCPASEFDRELKYLHNRLPDYLATADKVDFYYRFDMNKAKKVATLLNKELNIVHSQGFCSVQKSHDKATSQGAWYDSFDKYKIKDKLVEK